MELGKSIKQSFSTLQNQISDQSGQSNYILITEKKVTFKNKVFIKVDGTWVDDNTSEPSDVLLNVSCEEVDVIKNENSLLKKQIEKLNLKVFELEKELEEKEEEEENEEDEGESVIPKKKHLASQQVKTKSKQQLLGFLITTKPMRIQFAKISVSFQLF